VTAGVTEDLGSEIHVLFTVDAPQVQHPGITDATSGSDEDEAIPLDGGRSLWTARVAARSKVRTGQPIELAVDTSNLQFFDPESGLSIGHPQATS
jgi:multiple sugar transport system ATP-binding protein